MMLKRVLPYPALSLFLWLIWLLLNNTLGMGHVVLGAGLALALPWLVQDFLPKQVCFHKPFRALQLLMSVLSDIVLANILVARWIIGANKQLKPAFVKLELDMDSALGISILASIISLTPGTVSCDVSADRRYLLIHALHVDDVEVAVQQMKQRYEQPLLEIIKPC